MTLDVTTLDDLPPDDPSYVDPQEEDKGPKRPKWTPKTWKPVYQEVVTYHVMGFTNIEIADATGFTKYHIGLILGCPHALAQIEKVTERLAKIKLGKMQSKIQEMTDLALERVQEVLQNDELAIDQPFAMYDRAIKLAISARALSPTDGNITEKTENNNTLNVAGNVTALAVPKEMLEALLSGTKKADEVAGRTLKAITGNAS
jgi:hypothetical protein